MTRIKEITNANKILVGKTAGKKFVGRPKRRWVHGVDWIREDEDGPSARVSRPVDGRKFVAVTESVTIRRLKVRLKFLHLH
jgi:hypothetical protein